MYKGISAPFIHRPIATTLIMVAILLVGLVAFPSLPLRLCRRSTSRPSPREGRFYALYL